MAIALNLQRKYGVIIKRDDFYDPLKGRFVRAYKMFSADGCPWDNGFLSLKACEAECEKWSKALLDIKTVADMKKKGENT